MLPCSTKLVRKHFRQMTIWSILLHSSLHGLINFSPQNLQPKPLYFQSKKRHERKQELVLGSDCILSPTVTSSKSLLLTWGPLPNLSCISSGIQEPHLHPQFHPLQGPTQSQGPLDRNPLSGNSPLNFSLHSPIESRRGRGAQHECPGPLMLEEGVFLPSKPQTHSLSKAWRKSSWSAWTCSIFGFFTGNTAAPAAAAAEEEEEAE